MTKTSTICRAFSGCNPGAQIHFWPTDYLALRDALPRYCGDRSRLDCQKRA